MSQTVQTIEVQTFHQPFLFCLNQGSFHSRITDGFDLILVINGRRNNTPSFCIWREKEEKNPLEQLIGLANFILPQESMYMLLLSYIHLSFSLARLYSCLLLQCFQVEVCFTYGLNLIHHFRSFHCHDVAVGYGSPSSLISTFLCPSKEPGRIQSRPLFCRCWDGGKCWGFCLSSITGTDCLKMKDIASSVKLFI